MTHSLSLYQLSGNYLQALDFLTDPEIDVPTQVLMDTMESLTDELEDKAVNIAKFIRNLEATADAIKSAESEMAKRRKAFENRVQWLKDYLRANMEATGISKIECPYFKLSIAKNPTSVDLLDEALIPESFKRVETIVHIDKTAIKAALSAGHQVQGARLANGTRLVIK